MADPLCRWRYATPKTVVALVRVLPKQIVDRAAFLEYVKLHTASGEPCSFDTFQKTAYQLAVQLGLYYIDENDVYHPRFCFDIDEQEARKYLSVVAKNYVATNPYTPSLKATGESVNIYNELIAYVHDTGSNEFDVKEALQVVFNTAIGNVDAITALMDNTDEFSKSGSTRLRYNNPIGEMSVGEFFEKFPWPKKEKNKLPSAVDRLGVALKLFAEKRNVDPIEGWTSCDEWAKKVRENFAKADAGMFVAEGFDYAGFMHNFVYNVTVANSYFSKHTEEQKTEVGNFLAQNRNSPKAASWYMDESHFPQVGGSKIPGFGSGVALNFMMKIRPSEFATYSSMIDDMLVFAGLLKSPLPKDVTVEAYEQSKSLQGVVMQKMHEMGIGKAADDNSPADYLTVNEFAWWLNNGKNKDLIKEKVMVATYKKTEIKKSATPKRIDDFSAFIKKLEDDVASAGLKYAPNLMKRFVCALLAKPFVVLTGLSGSGKTKLAQAFAEWIAVKNTSLVVPVGADWTNSERLLGYPNALESGKYVLPETRVLEFILDASENKDVPFFLVLDEMNLSHVERYFADFLSAMESGDEIKLYSGEKRHASNGREIPQTLAFPKNLFVIGTMNVDETTYMFSPKVLDRAQVIEFRVSKDEMSAFLSAPSNPTLAALAGKGAEYAEAFQRLADARKDKKPTDESLAGIKNALDGFFPPLSELGAEFGYRTAIEIVTFVAYYIEAKAEVDNAIDAAIVQKLLPKLHGSQARLGPVLKKLKELASKKTVKEENGERKEVVEPLYRLTCDKLARMQERIKANGFTSFAEA